MSALLQNALTPHGHVAQYALSGLDVYNPYPTILPHSEYMCPLQPIPLNSLENTTSLFSTHHA
jgi:hypothetical protein